MRWTSIGILVAGVYAVTGIAFATLANASASSQMRITWRLTAWLISAAAFAAQVGYEHFRLRNASITTALHASVAVGVGAFVLAAVANVRALWIGSDRQALLAISLIAWPVLTAVPAFVVALAAAAGLTRTHWRKPVEPELPECLSEQTILRIAREALATQRGADAAARVPLKIGQWAATPRPIDSKAICYTVTVLIDPTEYRGEWRASSVISMRFDANGDPVPFAAKES